MNVFLTGGTGFIGQRLTKALLARGWAVTALVRNPDHAAAQVLRRWGVTLAAGDLAERTALATAMRGADLVVHNAGQYEFGVNREGRRRMQIANEQGTGNTLGLALELGIPRTVYVSTVLAFGDSGPGPRDETFRRQAACWTAYERSKTAAHEIALDLGARGLPLIIVCPNAVVGPNDHSIWGYFQRLYLNRMMPPVASSPDSVVCCVHVDDLAEGIALAAEKGRPGETYLLGGEPKTFRETMAIWAQTPGGFLPRIWLPAWLSAASFAPLEPLQRLLGLPAFLSRESMRAAAINYHFSSAKARRELGWTCRPAEAMWLGTLTRELELRRIHRTGQSWVRRLKPLEGVD